MHRKLLNLAVVFCGIVAALVMGEVLARNFLVLEKFISDPILERRGSTAFGHDKNGFRNSSIYSVASIVAIGDSQTYGDNAKMEESWPHVLSQLSSKIVYQMAFGGYGPPQYSYLFDKALEFHPDLVIVATFPGNDLRDAANDIYFGEYWKELRRENFMPQWQRSSVTNPDANLILQYGAENKSFKLIFLKFRNWIYGNSKLYVFLGKSTRILRERLGLAQTLEERDQSAFQWAQSHLEAGVAFERGNISTILAPQLRIDTIDLDNPNAQEGFRLTKELFTSIRDRAEGKTKLVFVYIPTKEFVYSHISDQEELKRFYAAESRLRDAFLKFCDSIKTTCIDTTGNLVAALEQDIPIVSLGTDGHYNAGGYAVIAKTIYNELR
ncbi:MAG: SGNH/GDSL hydrolase family protein [Patescibacteria group bacterium]